jgi:uncharacterized protein (DUF1697 family)
MATYNTYVALLRGINVGGSNLIKMADLKACFEKLGYANVRTYIQSGNVLFESTGSTKHLHEEIESALAKAFQYEPVVVVRAYAQLKQAVQKAPSGFGADPAFKYNVLFIKEPASAADVLSAFTAREGVDKIIGGDGAVYVSTLIAEATKSRLSRLVGLPIYKSITIRNWNTTIKLLQLMEATS